MTVRRWLFVALAATLLATAYAPTADADHCRTKLTVYGRLTLAPAPTPPYAASTAAICTSLAGRGVDDHLLPPQVDQVMVRVNGDYGPSLPGILVELDGLGFQDHYVTAVRTASPAGGFSYQLPEWLTVTDGPQSGTLVVTAYYPAGPVTATYRTAAPPAV